MVLNVCIHSSAMDFEDDLMSVLDWDPCYLARIFMQDFDDMSDLWNADGITDSEFMDLVNKSEVYKPIVEEISLDDTVLSDAVAKIEAE